MTASGATSRGWVQKRVPKRKGALQNTLEPTQEQLPTFGAASSPGADGVVAVGLGVVAMTPPVTMSKSQPPCDWLDCLLPSSSRSLSPAHGCVSTFSLLEALHGFDPDEERALRQCP